MCVFFVLGLLLYCLVGGLGWVWEGVDISTMSHRELYHYHTNEYNTTAYCHLLLLKAYTIEQGEKK